MVQIGHEKAVIKNSDIGIKISLDESKFMFGLGN